MWQPMEDELLSNLLASYYHDVISVSMSLFQCSCSVTVLSDGGGQVLPLRHAGCLPTGRNKKMHRKPSRKKVDASSSLTMRGSTADKEARIGRGQRDVLSQANSELGVPGYGSGPSASGKIS